MKIIKLTDKEFEELSNILWVQRNQCESAQDPESEDYEKEYHEIMLSIYRKFNFNV